MEEIGTLFIFILLIFFFVYPFYDKAKADSEKNGKVLNYNKNYLKENAKIIDVKVGTVGFKAHKDFRATVIFDDGFKYIKTVEPSNTEYHFTSFTYKLSVEDKMLIVKEAIEKHEYALGKESVNTMPNQNEINESDSLIEFNKKIFPHEEDSRLYQTKQLMLLSGIYDSDIDFVKIYIYCATHYLINKRDYKYVVSVLPVAHPELKSELAVKRIAAYTYTDSGSGNENFDFTKEEDIKIIDNLVEILNGEVVNKNFDNKVVNDNYEDKSILIGLSRDNPMYFKGVKAAEDYLNSLTDLTGNKLKIGRRYSYSVDNIDSILDCYTMLDLNSNKYGELYVSIYGTKNFDGIPKGYKRVTDLSSSDYVNSLTKEQKMNYVNNNNNEAYNAVRAINEIENIFEEVEIKNSKSCTDTINSNLKNISQTKNEDKEINTGSNKSNSQNNNKDLLFCRICGKKLPADSKFCKYCGTKVI